MLGLLLPVLIQMATITPASRNRRGLIIKNEVPTGCRQSAEPISAGGVAVGTAGCAPVCPLRSPPTASA